MLQLFANNQPLDLHDLSFTIVKKNYLDLEDSIEGGFVFNFSLRNTDKNKSIFGHPHRLNRLQIEALSFDARIVFSGLGIAEGTWKVVKATDKTLQLRMNVDNGAYHALINKVNLPEIFDESFTLNPGTQTMIQHANQVIQSNYPNVDYQFPVIYNPRFYGDMTGDDPQKYINPEYEGHMNLFDGDNMTFVNNNSGNKNTLVPQFFVFMVLKKCFTHFGYTVSGQLFSDQELMQLLMYNNYAIDYLTGSENVFEQASGPGNQLIAIINEEYRICWLSDDSTTPNQDPDDLFNLSNNNYTIPSPGTFQVTIQFGFSTQDNIDLIGQFFIDSNPMGSTILYPTPDIGYNQTFNLTFDSNDAGKKLDFRVTASSPGQATIGTFVFKVERVKAINRNDFANTITYANHMPDIPVKTFLSSVFKAFGIIPFWNHKLKHVELVLMKDLLQAVNQGSFKDNPVKDSIEVSPNDYEGFTFTMDWGNDDFIQDNFKEVDQFTELAETPTEGDYPVTTQVDVISRIKNTNRIFLRRFQTYMVLFKYYTDNYREQVIDSGEKTISIPAGMLMDDLVNPVNSGTSWIVPKISAEGTSAPFGLRNDFPLRFYFWRGIQTFYETYQMPLASTLAFNEDGTQIPGTQYEYRLDGDYGIIEKFYSDYIAWRKRRLPVEFEIQISAYEAHVLDLQKPYRSLEFLYLISKVEIPVSNKEMKTSMISAYTF